MNLPPDDAFRDASNDPANGCDPSANFARRLNAADSVERVGEAVRDAADKFFAWDSFSFDLYVPELDTLSKVLLFDVVDGKRVEVEQDEQDLTPSFIFREITARGSQLILRDSANPKDGSFLAFGDTTRRSASLMFVPVRNGNRIYGMVSFQSYTSNAYTKGDLEMLEIIADQCCGALIRLEVEKNYRSVVESSVQGVCRIKPAGAILNANRSLARMLGYETVNELLQSIKDVRQQLFLHLESYCEFERTIHEKETLEAFETHFQHKQHAGLWVAISAHIEKDDNGAPLFFEVMVQNITERKLSQLELARMEALYRSAINGAGAVSYATDFARRAYTFIDQGIQQLIGYAPHEMTPATWRDIVKKRIMLGDTAGLSAAEAAESVIKGKLHHWRCDMLVITRSGKQRWISDASVQNLDREGKPIGSFGILQDITERKQSEILALSLAKLNQELSTVTEPVAAAETISKVSQDLFTWDAFWVKLYNPEDSMLYRILSIDTVDGKQVRGKSRSPQRSTPFNDRVLKNGAELLLRDEPASMTSEAIPFGDKSRLSAAIMMVPIRYRNKVVGIVSAQSYTPQAYDQQNLDTFQMLADQCGGALERIWADEALRRSEKQFRLVWESSVDGMRLATEDGTVLMVNEAFCGIVGKKRSELEGKSLAEVHLPEHRDRVLEKHQMAFKGDGLEQRLEKQLTLWNQKTLWCEVSNSFLELPGHAPMLLSILRDITGRKESEVELASINKQLITTSRAAGMAEVASGVLHNVGNVLNSVNVAANVVTERLRNSRHANLKKISQLLDEHSSDLPHFFATDDRAKQLPAYIRKLADYLAAEQEFTGKELDTLRKNIDHIKDIVAMQQSYATMSGVIEFQSVCDLVDDALQMNAAALARHDVHLTKNYEATPSIATDKHKVLQILVNFIRNAKYACDEGGQPRKQVTISIRMPDQEHVHISVADNGVGIPEGNLTRIFVHGFTTRESGHGFGLHSSALAAKELGGAILVQSDGPGKGAIFTLELPVKIGGAQL